MADDAVKVVCKALPERWVWVKSRCGQSRDCIPDDRQNPFVVGWCGAMAWVNKHQTGWVEIWDPTNSYRLVKITSGTATPERVERCAARARRDPTILDPFGSGPDSFTIAIPGLTDIVRVPGLDTPELRKQRYERFKASRSPLPEGLKWLPPLLNKLDDAQDLLFTGLALAWPLLRRAAPWFLGPVGILLTINDLLNAFT